MAKSEELEELLGEVDDALQAARHCFEALECSETVESVGDFWSNISEAEEKAKECLDAIKNLRHDAQIG